MTDTRFRRVRDAVSTARRLEPAARAKLIASLDADIRDEVASLLAHDSTPANIVKTGALAKGLGEEFRPALDEIRRDGMPSDVGPYRIVELLGEGGMGVVFRAEQQTPIRREVALKLLRRSSDPEKLRRRFESELQTLAAMNHPGIAKVHDAGIHGDRPYFAMELVPGTAVTTYADDAHLGTRARLELFLGICDAVRHAHQRGVIHRDIKPSNILVGESDGTRFVKVIDFGIAMAIERDDAAPAGAEPIGTPAYMSPEQAEGEMSGIDTRSDVYSLGVVLYELLTAKLPYEITAGTTAEAIREITSRERPAAPSAVAPARGLEPDVDAIVIEAIEPEREARYASVEQLAEDVARYLRGHAVLARRGGKAYVWRKFVRRNAPAVGVAAVFVALLVGFTIVTAIQSARIARERDRAIEAEGEARTQADTSGEVLSFLTGIFDVANPGTSRGEELTVREVLGSAVERIRTELVDRPIIRARLLHTLGEVYHSLGAIDRARELVLEALEIRREHLGEEHADVAASVGLLAVISHDEGDYVRAIELGEQTVRIVEAVLSDDHPDMGLAYANLASAVQALGDAVKAESYARRALEVHRRAFGEEHADVGWDAFVLGWALHEQGRLDEAAIYYEQALDVQLAVHGDDHPETANTMNNLAGLLAAAGDAAGAERRFAEVLATYRRLYGEDHGAVARSYANHASSLRVLGRLDEADRQARKAIDVNRRVLGEDHTHTASTYQTLADIQRAAGAYDDAATSARTAIAIRERLGLTDHPRHGYALVDLAAALRGTGALEEAERTARRGLEVLRAAGQSSRFRYGIACVDLVWILVDRARDGAVDSRADRLSSPTEHGVPEVELLAREALARIQTSRPSSHWEVANGRHALAMALLSSGEPSPERRADAEHELERAAADLASALGGEHALTRSVREDLETLRSNGPRLRDPAR